MDGAGTGGDGHGSGVDIEDVGRVQEDVRSPSQAGCGQASMDSADCQHGRDRQAIDGHADVGDDQQPGSAPSRRQRLGHETVERCLQPLGTSRRRPGRVKSAGVRCTIEQAIEVDHEGSLEPQAPRVRPRTRAGEHRVARPELDSTVDHGPFALGIDGRIGDLGERLAQVVGHRSVGSSARRRGRIVAHAPEWLVAFDDHGPDVEPVALSIEAGQEADVRPGRRSARSLGGARGLAIGELRAARRCGRACRITDHHGWLGIAW